MAQERSIIQYSHLIWHTHQIIWLIKMWLKKTYRKVHIEIYLPDVLPTEISLNPEYALFLMPFNSALEYAIRKVQKFRRDWN
jgi:hypothetical protein